MTDETKLQSFAEFWPFYLGEHRSPTNRGLHYFGTSTAIVIVAYAALSGRPLFGLWALLAGYGCAWIGHFRVELNRPATFTYPRWSLLGDFKMLFYFLTGRIGGEMVRFYGSKNPTPEAPLLAGTPSPEVV
jgi:hypothetical protein